MAPVTETLFAAEDVLLGLQGFQLAIYDGPSSVGYLALFIGYL